MRSSDSIRDAEKSGLEGQMNVNMVLVVSTLWDATNRPSACGFGLWLSLGTWIPAEIESFDHRYLSTRLAWPVIFLIRDAMSTYSTVIYSKKNCRGYRTIEKVSWLTTDYLLPNLLVGYKLSTIDHRPLIIVSCYSTQHHVPKIPAATNIAGHEPGGHAYPIEHIPWIFCHPNNHEYGRGRCDGV
jgi:hypothetical protein